MINYILSQIPGFVTGVVCMAFFYYRNKKKMDALVQKATKEKNDLIDQIKAKAQGK